MRPLNVMATTAPNRSLTLKNIGCYSGKIVGNVSNLARIRQGHNSAATDLYYGGIGLSGNTIADASTSATTKNAPHKGDHVYDIIKHSMPAMAIDFAF